MIPKTVPIYCIAIGKGDHDLYVRRLYAMLQRHMPCPFTLTCYSDLPRHLPEGIDLQVRNDWEAVLRPGMRKTTTKLRFFDKEFMAYPEFLYLDTTLVIRQSMQSLLDSAFSSPADLVIVHDWNTQKYNSCVMRIRRGPLHIVYDNFIAGKVYEQRVKGDQEFIYYTLHEAGLENKAAFFPEGEIISYRNARNLNREDPAAAKKRVESATILKFYGSPKPHQVLNPIYNLFKIRLRNFPEGFRDASFALDELRQHWRD